MTPPKDRDVTVDITQITPDITTSIPLSHSKITVKSSISSFDKVLNGISNVLHPAQSVQQSKLTGWNAEVVTKMDSLMTSLMTESKHYFTLSQRNGFKDKALRSFQLACAGVTMFINTSSIEDTHMRTANIAVGVFCGFLGGLEGIYRFHSRSLVYKEIAMSLEGLARTLRSQMLLAEGARRDPSELVIFIESTRDKMLKKLIN